MPSPFPGMDPYLESSRLWPGFHASFIDRLKALLNRTLPDGFTAVSEVRQELMVFADEHGDPSFEARRRIYVPEVSVERTGSVTAARGQTAESTYADWHEVPLHPESVSVSSINIVRLSDENVVAEIELLSPTNKRRGPARSQFLSRKSDALAAAVTFIEIDLLIGGLRAVEPSERAGELFRLDESTPYYVAIYPAQRSGDEPVVQSRRFCLTEPLPDLPIPLQGAGTPVVSLQDVMNEAYTDSRFHSLIDYTKPPTVSLSEPLQQQIASFVPTPADE